MPKSSKFNHHSFFSRTEVGELRSHQTVIATRNVREELVPLIEDLLAHYHKKELEITGPGKEKFAALCIQLEALLGHHDLQDELENTAPVMSM